MSIPALQKVDHSALKANQLTIIGLNILAFVLNLPWLAAFVALVMGIGPCSNCPVLFCSTVLFTNRSAFSNPMCSTTTRSRIALPKRSDLSL